MKQLFRMFMIDLKTSMKSFMSGYIVIVPMVILFVLRTFLPSVESTSANIAIPINQMHPSCAPRAWAFAMRAGQPWIMPLSN